MTGLTMTEKKRRSQAERTAASDSAMYKAAVKLIARDGPQAMTLANVGKEAGFTGGLVSYRFGSKIGLLKAVSTRILELWRKRVLAKAFTASNGSTLDYLLSTIDIYLKAIKTRSDLMLALFRMFTESYSSYPELRPYFQEYDREARNSVSSMVVKAQESGEVSKEIDADTFAVLYIGSLRGTAMQYFVDGDEIDLEATKLEMKRYCRLMLTNESN